MAFTINWKIALVFLLSTPLIVFVLYRVMSRSLPEYTRIQRQQDVISRLAGENLEGARVIRAFSKQDSEIEQFQQAGDTLSDITIRVGKLFGGAQPHHFGYRKPCHCGHRLVRGPVCAGRRHRAGPDHRHGELYDADAAGAHRSGEHHRYPHEGAGQREARKRSAGTGKLYAGAAPKRRGEARCAAH